MDNIVPESLLQRVDTLTTRLVRHAAPVHFAVASTLDQREAIWRLRAQTVIERGWAPASAFPDGMERDRHDDRAVLVAGWFDSTIVAAARIVFPAPGHTLPTEEAFGVTPDPAGQVANVDRMVVARASSDSSHRVFAGLAGRCWLEMRAHGYHRCIGCETPAVIRLYRRLGWLVTPLGPPQHYWGEERIPCRFDPRDGFATPLPEAEAPASQPA